MMCRRLTLLAALAALLLVTGRAKADLLAVEDQTTGPNVLRFNGAGTQFTFATANLDGPIGIALDSASNVYVTDQGQVPNTGFSNSVAKYSPTGTPLGFLISGVNPPGITPGNGGLPILNAPFQTAFDSNGNSYTTSQTFPNPPFGFIAEMNSAGVFVQSIGVANTNVPSGIGFNPFNHLLYVVNSATTGGPGPNLNSILIYNPANITAAPTIITPTGAGALDGGQQIAFDGAGNVYIASVGATTGVAKILEYNQNGVFIGAGKFATPAGATDAYGVAVDPFNNLLYASFLNNGTNGVIEKYNLTTGADLGVFASGLNNVAYITFTAVPEPGSIVLTGMGLIGLAGFNVYRRKRVA